MIPSTLNALKLASLITHHASQLDNLQSHYISAFSSTTELGAWLEKRPITHRYEDLIFLHGGINPVIFRVEGGLASREDLANLNVAFNESSSEVRLNSFMKSLHGQIVYDLVTYRGNHKSCDEVAQICDILGISKIIVGHTPDDDVRVMCKEQFLAIDSALGRWIRVNGNQYCRGTETKVAKNGRYSCDEIGKSCEGQIVKLTKGGEGWDVEVLKLNSTIKI